MTQLDLFSWRAPLRTKPKRRQPCEWKIVAVRESAAPEKMPLCYTSQAAVDYWRSHVATAPHFNSEVESFVVLLLNTRKRIKGHHLVSIGSLNEVAAHPREVFRAAVIAAAHVVALMHNHPSGEVQPSQSDISVTRLLVNAGKTLRIEVVDHIIVGHNRHCSLRELGHI
jgi:DNA repair protein RadC